MKELFAIFTLSFLFVFTAGYTGLWDEFKDRAETVHHYEYKSLELSKKVRMLEKENNDLRAQVQKLTTDNKFLTMNLNKKKSRSIASIPTKKINDLVNYDIYKWSPSKLLGVGRRELHFKNYEKSAQFLNTLVEKFPSHQSINDKVLFEAGLSAFESGKHYDWATNHFDEIVKNYPQSKYFRGAKLWLALSLYHVGEHAKFMTTVEEFKMKYRNTQEWKILSKYYEDLSLQHSSRGKKSI